MKRGLRDPIFTLQMVVGVDAWNKCLNTPIEEEDPEIYALIEKEKWRQFSCLELIASEVEPLM